MRSKVDPLIVYCDAPAADVRAKIQAAGGEIVWTRFTFDDRTRLERWLKCLPLSGELLDLFGGTSALVLHPAPLTNADIWRGFVGIVLLVAMPWILGFPPQQGNDLWFYFYMVFAAQGTAYLYARATIQPRIRARFMEQIGASSQRDTVMPVAPEIRGA